MIIGKLTSQNLTFSPSKNPGQPAFPVMFYYKANKKPGKIVMETNITKINLQTAKGFVYVPDSL